MTRSDRLYRDGAAVRDGFAGFDPDTPDVGFYRMRLTRGGAWVGVKIFYGPPCDPDTGEEMDRSWRHQAHVNGEYREIASVWPRCAGDPITEQNYAYLARLPAWAKDAAPGSGLDDPRKPIDALSTPLLF